MATSKDLQNNKLQHKDKYNNGALKGENEMNQAMKLVIKHLKSIYPYEFSHESSITLSKIIEESLPEYKNFLYCESTSSRAQPDGGIIYLHIGNYKFPILMAENKLQGTIDKLAKQGKKQIAQGNAIERLGKNVLLFQTYLRILGHNIFPFVCFGNGYDFKEGSTIRDRVIAINMLGKLNEINVHNVYELQRGSYFFRYEEWTCKEMLDTFKKITEISIQYYLKKYGKS
jgi:type II restriction enzyme